MTKNRKNTETYRFNGVWGMRPVEIAELETWIKRFERKLVASTDWDHKKWTTRWLQRFHRELSKKRRNRDQKQADQTKRHIKLTRRSRAERLCAAADDHD